MATLVIRVDRFMISAFMYRCRDTCDIISVEGGSWRFQQKLCSTNFFISRWIIDGRIGLTDDVTVVLPSSLSGERWVVRVILVSGSMLLLFEVWIMYLVTSELSNVLHIRLSVKISWKCKLVERVAI